MGVVLAISVACLAAVLVLAARRRRAGGRPHTPRGEPAAPSHDGFASRIGERCLLCNGPLPSRLVTREQVVARVEHLIDADTAAVARLLANPPSAAWLSLFRP